MPGGPPPRWLEQASAGALERGSRLVSGIPGDLPVMTLVVTLLTAVVASVGFLDPHVQAALRRDPGALAAGSAVERWLGPWRWLVLYPAGGLAGEVTGSLWDPTGAGSSVAMLGLFAGVWQRLFARPGREGRAVRLVGLAGITLLAALIGAALAPAAVLLPALLAGLTGGLAIQLLRRVPRATPTRRWSAWRWPGASA